MKQNGNFDSCNSCERLVPSRLHELHESKFPFVSRIEFIRSKLSNFSAHVYEVVTALYRSAVRVGVLCCEPSLSACYHLPRVASAWHPPPLQRDSPSGPLTATLPSRYPPPPPAPPAAATAGADTIHKKTAATPRPPVRPSTASADRRQLHSGVIS